MGNNMHPELEKTIQEMIEAINEAIDDANRNKTRYTAVRGLHHTSGAGGSYYTFVLQDDWEPGPNTSVLIEIDPDDPEHTIPGTILSTLNAQITLVTETPLPQAALTGITLLEATVWLLEKLRAALIALLERGETPAQMAAKTFGLLPSYEGTGQRSARIAGFIPDPDQERAIALGMESERLFLIGPPGTGKTSVESALAIEHLLADKTVLVAAYTNGALDNAMRRLSSTARKAATDTWSRSTGLCALAGRKTSQVMPTAISLCKASSINASGIWPGNGIACSKSRVTWRRASQAFPISCRP